MLKPKDVNIGILSEDGMLRATEAIKKKASSRYSHEQILVDLLITTTQLCEEALRDALTYLLSEEEVEKLSEVVFTSGGNAPLKMLMASRLAYDESPHIPVDVRARACMVRFSDYQQTYSFND